MCLIDRGGVLCWSLTRFYSDSSSLPTGISTIIMSDRTCCSLILLMMVFIMCAQCQPQITSGSDTVGAYVGQTAVLTCLFQNLGSSQMRWSSMSHDFVIFEGSQLLTDNAAKYSLIHKPGGHQYNLQISKIEKSDQGFYKCVIEGTQEDVIIHLNVVDMPNLLMPTMPPMNMTDCCLLENVSQSCLPACYPSQIDLEKFNASTQCGTVQDLKGLSKCFTAGSNHDNCCLNMEVDLACLDFCHNAVPENMTMEHIDKCFTNKVINGLFTCFQFGFEYLPSEPTEVAALPLGLQASQAILVKWSEPKKNPNTVIGYKIMFKPRSQETYNSRIVKDSQARNYRLDGINDKILPDMSYKIHVSALAEHGVSFGSVEVDVYVPDSQDSINQAINIDKCCSNRKVSNDCKNLLCHARTWTQFNTDHVLECYPDLSSVFTCLVGERNNTNCCTAFDVTPECLPLCSGQPPTFNMSLIGCVSQMGIVEACVQKGLETLPAPPTLVTVVTVDISSAVMEFQPSPSPDLLHYLVGLRMDNEQSPFVYNETVGVTDRTVYLDDLSPDTYYWVRIVAVGATADSLPSDTVSFLTYPIGYSNPTPDPVINLPHNMTDCCRRAGMQEECWRGCEYRSNITSYYSTRLGLCFSHIGSVLACAADGRDHSECCRSREVKPVCVELCAHTKKGPLELKYIQCVDDTSKAVMCFQEGIVNLPRHPDIVVSSVSKNHIGLSWEQPKTSGRIDLYNITYGIRNQKKLTASTNQTFYILQNLLPGKPYEISIISVNSNGSSSPSPLITQYTMIDDDVYITPTYNRTEISGKVWWQNISHCCENSVRDECVQQCLNKPTASLQYSSCVNESNKMLACYADGRDHRLCCEENALPATCVPICDGHMLLPNIGTATCLSQKSRQTILSCFLENKSLLPNAPVNISARLTEREGYVKLDWSLSKSCNINCTYEVHFWKTDDLYNTQTVSDISNNSVILKVEAGSHYTFTVTARNQYGSSVPSPWLTLYITHYDRIVHVYLDGDEQWAEQSQPAKLICAINGFNPDTELRREWFFNSRRKLDNNGKKELVIDKVDSVRDEGSYTCSVTDPTITSSDIIFLAVKTAPMFNHLEDESVQPGNGKTGSITCFFRGIPDLLSHVWFRDWRPLMQDPSKHLIHFMRHFDTGLTAYKLQIVNVVLSDYGMYSLKVSNIHGSAECHVNFTNTETSSSEEPITKILDPKQCCDSNGVSDICQELCGFNIDVGTIISDAKYISCVQYFRTYISCGADGRNHSKCCQQKGILPSCVPLCSGVVPDNLLHDKMKLLQCVGEVSLILSCVEEGHDLLPYPPSNISLSLVADGGSILVRWSKPVYFNHKVNHYTIFYNFTGSPAPKLINTNNRTTESYIKNVVPGAAYSVWMTAGNENGDSQPTNIQTIATSTTDGQIGRQINDADSTNKVAVGVGVTLAVVAIIAIVVLIIFFVRRGKFFQSRKDNSVTFGNQGQIKIQGMEDQFSYGRLHEDGPPAVLSSQDTSSTGESAGDSSFENLAYQAHQSSSNSNSNMELSHPGESKT